MPELLPTRYGVLAAWWNGVAMATADGDPISATETAAAGTRVIAGWTVPAGYEPKDLGTCRSCGTAMLWTYSPNHKLAPLDRDGRSHFATCPSAPEWRRGR